MQAENWYQFTPATSGIYRVNTCSTTGSFDDTVLEIYDTCPNPSAGACVASGDDECGASAFLSDIPSVTLDAGNTYYIAAGGWNGAQGQYQLDVTLETPFLVSTE
jgi:hypothetical protein